MVHPIHVDKLQHEHVVISLFAVFVESIALLSSMITSSMIESSAAHINLKTHQMRVAVIGFLKGDQIIMRLPIDGKDI